MDRRKKLILAFIVAGLLVSGCTPVPLNRVDDEKPSASYRPGVEEHSSRQESWERLRFQPGIPGKDYSPETLLVIYKANPLPLLLKVVGPQESVKRSSVAASRPNAILRQNRHYEPITDAISIALGITISQQVYQGNINAASFVVSPSQDSEAILPAIREKFAGQVDYAVYSPLHHAGYIPNDPDYQEGAAGRQWDLWRIGCTEAWDYERGEESIRIGVVDTGVRITHEELVGQVLDPAVHFPEHSLDVCNGDNTVEDLEGHGTFIAGLAVAAGDNGNKITGVAPGCRVIPVKISDDMNADTLDVIAGCLLAYNLGAKVINLSFSTPSEIPIERDMVNEIWNGGAVFVSIAGNFGVETDEYPGAFENAISVGGTNKDDDLWELSNYGASVTLAAPSMRLRGCTRNTDYGYYSNGAGTSYGAGIVSGALGLLLSLGSDVTNVEARSALEASGVLVDGFISEVRRIDVGTAITDMANNNNASATQLMFAPRVCGKALEEYYLVISLDGTDNVAKVYYTLDLAPVGQVDGYDLVAEISSGDTFPLQLFVSQDCPNQQARLIAQCYNAWDIPGEVLEQDVLIYNLLGDTNCDGLIDALDVEFLKSKLGLAAPDPQYSVFADTNLDGLVSEADLAWVGYNWGT